MILIMHKKFLKMLMNIVLKNIIKYKIIYMANVIKMMMMNN